MSNHTHDAISNPCTVVKDKARALITIKASSVPRIAGFRKLNLHISDTLLVIRNDPKYPDLKHDIQIRRWIYTEHHA